uniref:Uncharacterized protein n=1 Tax=Fagus sylvatica TaxID=28930 RepID=A0A2N9FXW2_FAGSY
MMASICLSIPNSKTLAIQSPPPPSSSATATYTSSSRCRCSLVSFPMFDSWSVVSSNRLRANRQVVRMAPDEEKLTRRNPLDFPIEWERPKPGRRPDIFPQFSPMKTPLPPPLPYDPPEEDEEEEEKKEEEEEDPDKEEPDQPDKQ